MARPALEALAEQQKRIDAQDKIIRSQDEALGNMAKVARMQHDQIERISRGLQTISQLAGVENKVASAMGLKFVQADAQNPSQPVPEPPAVPATQSTPEAEAPEAMADVQSPGLVPGSTNDVAADVTTTNYTPGQDVPAPAFKNLQDVTAPVDGAQNPRPINETKTLTDVRVGDPMNPQTAFPPRGDFANAQRTDMPPRGASKDGTEAAADEASLRTMASIRLARLQIQAGMAKTAAGGDLELSERINKDAARSTEDIEREIDTLTAVLGAQKKQASRSRNPRLVPQASSPRSTPSMSGSGRGVAGDNDEDLFLGF